MERVYSLIMAKLLISYPQRAGCQENNPNQLFDLRNSEPYRVALNEEVLAEIKQNYAGISEVIPVLSLGNSQCGRASTLEAFLDGREEGSFSSEDKPPGVYVWTKPVPLNNMSLLLVKMWGVEFLQEEDEELDLITKKVLVALMSISSVCLFCGDKSSMFEYLTAIYELHKEIKERLHLQVSKFLVFVYKEVILANSFIKRQHEIFNNRRFENPPEMLYRGHIGVSTICKESLRQIVGNLQNHEPFVTSHRKVLETIQTPDMINALAIILKQILNVAELDLDFRNFIGKIPSFISPSYREEMRHLEEIKKISKSVLSATALNIFDRTMEESTSYKISNSLLPTLLKQYEPNRPIIVMAIIGYQGIGKSTLLNHIVKYYLGCPTIRALFKAGHFRSEVLSSPLRLGEKQLMLVELEGLECMEIYNERERILKENMLSAILTIASVPCILIRNEVQSIGFVERISSKLSILKTSFGYKLERVHLLLHDRDLNADTNVDIENHIQRMNRQYFAGETVLTLRNKPNFSDASKAKMCEDFMRGLMADSDFPKKNKFDSPVLLKQLISDIAYITEYSSTEMSEIRLSDQKTQECNRFLSCKSPQLRNIFENSKGNETNGSLESNFNEQCRQFITDCIMEMKQLRVKWILRARITLDIDIVSYRAEILGIEYCYQSIKNLSVKESSKKLKEQLKFLYRKNWYVGTFNDSAAELKKKLVSVKERYPCSVQTMDQILLKFEEKRNNLENWFYANYGFQVVTTAASAGFGLAARGAMVAVDAARLGLAAVAGGAAVAARIGFGAVVMNLALNENASELFTMNKPILLRFMKTSTTLNSEAIRILEEVNPYPVTVLLVIAAKELGASFLLNEFIHCIAPFTPSSIVAFSSSKLTQIIHFNYMYRRACIIYLRMKKNKTKDKYKIIEKIAISLIPKASLTCLFFDSPSKYADDIITKAFPAEREAHNQRFSPRVAAIYSENRDDSAFVAKLSALERRGVNNTRTQVRDFSNKSLKCAVPDVKNKFDISTPLESRALLEALRYAELTANS